MSSALRVKPACAGDPVTNFCKFNDVSPSRIAELTMRQCAETSKGIRCKTEIVIDDVGKQFGHVTLENQIVICGLIPPTDSTTDYFFVFLDSRLESLPSVDCFAP